MLQRFLLPTLLSVTFPMAQAISLGQIDDFEDGTVMNWAGGASPTNVLGGPGGANDHYLQITANPSGAQRLATFNVMQWSGDYASAGVKVIEADMKNDGPDPLLMRIVMFARSDGSRFVSTVGKPMPPDGVWRHVVFPIGPSYLTRVIGGATFSEMYSDCERLMFRHNTDPPVPGGTTVVATLGIDNITALDAATVEPESFTLPRGIALSGTLSSLFASDDNRLVIRPGIVLSSVEAPAQLQVLTTAPFLGASQLTFRVEASVNQANLTERIYLFNQTTSQYDLLDTAPATLSDTVRQVTVTGANVSNYINGATSQMKALVTFKASGPILAYPWQARIDQTVWQLTP